jgi:DNA helicase HerA-like ATPase
MVEFVIESTNDLTIAPAMTPAAPLPIARSGDRDLHLLPALANRHGLITGATGTGKTVSLQLLAERLSSAGVSVFMADVKGDLTGIAQAGSDSSRLRERVSRLGCDMPQLRGMPVCLWDVFGERGHPVRTTISDMGPLLLSRLLELNDTQAGVLQLVFRLADDEGLLLLDLKDLKAVLQYAADHARELAASHGNVSSASVGAIQRALLTLEAQGAEHFFGEPMLDIRDLMRTDEQGRGVVNILAADRLLGAPRLYAASLLWLLSELYENLPERGDRDKPLLVFFFDEAHLLFNDAPRVLVERIEQVVRLIRSKGVGVFFVSQTPADIPDAVLAQLGNRIQHALRAFTPRDQKAVRVAAETMRPNPRFDAADVIGELGVGEALVSLLDSQGRPTMVERGFILPPGSRIGPITDDERGRILRDSPLAGRYDAAIDRESAFERLNPAATVADEAPQSRGAAGSLGELLGDIAGGLGTGRGRGSTGQSRGSPVRNRSAQPESLLGTIARGAARSIGSAIGREIVRGVLGTLIGRRR